MVRIAPRRSVLRRSADDTDPIERAIVANADQLLIVTALADPPPRLRLIDRFLVAAYDAGLEPVLCLTKADLAGPSRCCRSTSRSACAAWCSAGRSRRPSSPSCERARREGQRPGRPLGGRQVDLVNALILEADRAVGEVSPVTGRGRHTSSSVVALALPAGGWIIDTPGLRGFGLGHLSPERVVRAFPDLAAGAEECPPGCDHLGPECALDGWVAGADGEAGGGALTARLDSLRRLLRSREGDDAE